MKPQNQSVIPSYYISYTPHLNIHTHADLQKESHEGGGGMGGGTFINLINL